MQLTRIVELDLRMGHPQKHALMFVRISMFLTKKCLNLSNKFLCNLLAVLCTVHTHFYTCFGSEAFCACKKGNQEDLITMRDLVTPILATLVVVAIAFISLPLYFNSTSEIFRSDTHVVYTLTSFLQKKSY